jgi:hypothetical protein
MKDACNILSSFPTLEFALSLRETVIGLSGIYTSWATAFQMALIKD